MKTRTMYMHTLDGKPATYSAYGEWRSIHLASRGHRARGARLVDSLRHLRMQQQWAFREALRDWDLAQQQGWANHPRPDMARYGYVLVRVPIK